MSFFLGVDTSNYTTSLALCCDGRIIANLKAPVFVAQGKRGTRQSDAVFSHNKNFPLLFEHLKPYLENGRKAASEKSTDGCLSCDFKSISALGVSSAPRDADGSYMPCFLAGIAAASGISALTGVPLYRFSHQRGHIYAALYSSEMTELYTDKFIAFHMSGGTSEVLLVNQKNIQIIGGTRDLTAGQLIDRTGVMLGVPFPCGAELEKLALDAELSVKPKICVERFECNLSGCENKVSELIKKGFSPEETARYAIETVRATLDKICENIRIEFGNIPILFSGGVMSCSIIRDSLREKYGAFFAQPEYSCDNAAGIALLCEREYYSNK